RMLNLFYYSAKIGYQWAPFSVVDPQGRLFRDLVATGVSFLKPYWEAGALYGKKQDDAFIVIADDSNNPPEELQAHACTLSGACICRRQRKSSSSTSTTYRCFRTSAF